MTSERIITGSVGASEGLEELDQFFDKIATVEMHEKWGRDMGEVIVDGSTKWEVFKIV